MTNKRKLIRAASPATGKPIIAMTGEVVIRAAEGEGGKSGPPTFDVVAYTGQPMSVEGYDLPVLVDLSGMTFGKSLIANLDHDRTRRVGHVTAHQIDAGQLSLSGVASAATPYRDEVIASAASGFVWQASIEAKPTTMTPVKAGVKVTANGREWEGPLYHVTASTLKGFAFVSHGADDDTTVSIAAMAATSTRNTDMEPKFKAWVEAMGFDVDSLTESQLAGLKANYSGRQAPPPAETASDLSDVLATARAEDARRRGIADLSQKALRDNPHLTDIVAALATDAMENGKSLMAFELELLRRLRPEARVNPPPVPGPNMNNKVLEAALCQYGRLATLEKHYTDQQLQAAHDQFPNGLKLGKLFCMAAKANGYRGDTYDVTLDVQRYAFGMVQGQQIHAGAFSTLSLPGILSNVANKFLMEGWLAQDMAWRSIAKIRSVSDFKTVTSYKMSGAMTYEKLGPSGELKHGTVSEDSYTNKAETYGKMFAITRTDIINDDLGALTQVPLELGIGASDKFNDVFWTAFLDNSAFFVAGNSNVSTGGGSALALAGLNAAEVIFMAQTKPNGKPLGTMPRILLVPPTLRNTALTLMNSAQLIDGTGTAAQGSANVYEGRYAVVSSSYMENSSYTGYSTAAWYLLADPMRLPTIEAAFLNGREAPVVETADAAFNVLGVEMRGYHDFGVNLQEYRGGVRSAGS